MDALLDRHRAEFETNRTRANKITQDAADENRDLTPGEEAQLQEITERMEHLGNTIGTYAAVQERTNATAALIAGMNHDGENALIRAEAPNLLTDLYGGPQGAARYISDYLCRKENPEAAERIQRVVQNVVTTGNPGVVPDPLVGSLIDLGRDSRMPVANSFRQEGLNGRGPVFYRPRVTQHTQVGVQVTSGGVDQSPTGAGEKTELASRAYTTERVTVEVNTVGGVVDVARQLIDFSNVDAIQAIVSDLQIEADIQSESAAATLLNTVGDANLATTTITGTVDGAEFTAAVYNAATKVFTAVGMLPTHLAMSIDQWAILGGLTDADGRPIFPFMSPSNATGQSSASSFNNGPVAGLIPVVSSGLPAKSIIAYYAPAFEHWRQEIGTLQAVEPRLLGVEVAYGRYTAWFCQKAGAASSLNIP